MNSAAIELWLIAQMIIEVILCSIIIFYVLRDRGSRQEKRQERERTKALIQTLDRLIVESEDLEKKHQKLLQLWEKMEKKGSDMEVSVEVHEERPPASSVEKDEEKEVESGIKCYEKTLQLIGRGLPAGEIAQQVGLPRGEVELIMNLKEQ
jgi:hypothetical protein